MPLTCTRLGNWSIFNLGLRLHWGQEQNWMNLMLMSKNNRFCLLPLHLSHVKNGVWLRKRGISTYDYFITEIIKFMHQSIPAAPNPPPPVPWPHPRELALFLPWMANSQGWGLLSCQIPRGGDKKRGQNIPSSVNTATFFIDRTVKECHFKHLNVRFFGSINVFLCNSVILIKTSRRDDTSLWF